MPYLMSDDEFPEHPKVDPLSDGAFRLHVSGMHYCAAKLTDGHVPVNRVARLTPHYRPKHLTELIDGALWHHAGHGCGTATCPTGEEGTGYVVHDYLQWNKSRDWWERKRSTEAARLARWRAKRRDEEGDEPLPEPPE